jgi:hypothetical protein
MTDTPDALAEREAIVAWLRWDGGKGMFDPRYELGIDLADFIERGDHIKGKE